MELACQIDDWIKAAKAGSARYKGARQVTTECSAEDEIAIVGINHCTCIFVNRTELLPLIQDFYHLPLHIGIGNRRKEFVKTTSLVTDNCVHRTEQRIKPALSILNNCRRPKVSLGHGSTICRIYLRADFRTIRHKPIIIGESLDYWRDIHLPLNFKYRIQAINE